MKRTAAAGVALLVAAAAAGLWWLAPTVLRAAPSASEIERLVQERGRLEDEVRALLAQQDRLDFGAAPQGNVLVGVPNVVSEALSVCAWTSRSATRLRSGDIGTISSRGSTWASRSSTDGPDGTLALAPDRGSSPDSRAATRCDGVSFISAFLSSVCLPLPPRASEPWTAA